MSGIKELLLKIHRIVPENCRDNRQYIQAADFIAHREFDLAIESFLELTEETEAIYPQEYWDLLAEAGRKAGINNIDDRIRIYRKS